MIPSREAAQSLVTMRAAFWRVCANASCADSARALLCPSYAIVLETRKAARACLSSVVLQRGSAAVWQLPSPQKCLHKPAHYPAAIPLLYARRLA